MNQITRVLPAIAPRSDLETRLNPENLKKMGRLAAELHVHSESYSRSEQTQIPVFDKLFPFDEPPLLFEARYRQFFPSERKRLFLDAIQKVDIFIHASLAIINTLGRLDSGSIKTQRYHRKLIA